MAGGIKINIKKSNIKVKARGSGLDNAKAGFKDITDQFDQFKECYDKLDQEEKEELNAVLGEDLAQAIADGSKSMFESEIETADDLSAIWDKLQPLIADE